MLERPFGRVGKIERQCAYAEPPAQPENTYHGRPPCTYGSTRARVARRAPQPLAPRGAPFFGLISIQKVTKSRNRAPRRRRSDPRRSCAARASPRGGRGMGGSISHARVARTAWRPRASAPSPSLNFRKLVTFQILEGNPVRVRQPSVGPKISRFVHWLEFYAGTTAGAGAGAGAFRILFTFQILEGNPVQYVLFTQFFSVLLITSTIAGRKIQFSPTARSAP